MSKDRYAISSLNPHTHAGCDNRYKCNYTRRRVSIHTPTQGVTKLRLLCFGSSWFQSTHPRRVWPSCWLLCIILIKFQSTHPRRVWPSYKIVVVRPFLFQSTHPRRVWLRHITDTVSHHEFQSTHPRRVWLSTAKVSILLSEFQSTHPRRVWPERPITDTPNCWFQSTHPRRVWQRLHPPVVPEDGFNPHTHAGCDTRTLDKIQHVQVSIHTPTQGVTLSFVISPPVNARFNPHTHAGCD